jgi:hypothetical protein
MEELQALSAELGYPSADKLWLAARRRKLPVTKAEVTAFTKRQSPRQVFAARPQYDGKVVASRANERWAADLIDYTATPSKAAVEEKKPYQCILIVQDIYSRKQYSVALREKTQATVTQAFEHNVREAHAKPSELDTDQGPEFEGPFEEYLADEHIAHTTADLRNFNARGTLDAAIRSFKQQLTRIQVAEKTRDWASLVQRATKAYNNTSHSGIMNAAPNEVSEDEDLQFLLEEKAAQGLQHNQNLALDRGAQLERRGAFREELPRQGRGFERNFRPRFSGEVHNVSKVLGTTVFSDGKAYPTRHVLPAAARSENVDIGGLTGGSEQVNKARLDALEPFKEQLVAFLGNGKWLHEMAAEMVRLKVPGLRKNGFSPKKALLLLGFHVAENGKVMQKPRFRATKKTSPIEAAAALAAPRRRFRIKSRAA